MKSRNHNSSASMCSIIEGDDLRELNEIVALESETQFIVDGDSYYDYLTLDVLKSVEWDLKYKRQLFYIINPNPEHVFQHLLLNTKAGLDGYDPKELLFCLVPWDHQNGDPDLEQMNTLDKFMTVLYSEKYKNPSSAFSEEFNSAMANWRTKQPDYLCNKGFSSKFTPLSDYYIADIYKDLIMLEMGGRLFSAKQLMELYPIENRTPRRDFILSVQVTNDHIELDLIEKWLLRKRRAYPNDTIVIHYKDQTVTSETTTSNARILIYNIYEEKSKPE